MTKLHEIARLGQSIWYDNIRRGLMDSGEFQKLLDDGVLGVTSNPTIFQKAIVGSDDYDSAMNALIGQGCSVSEIYESLVLEDIGRAADMLRPIYDRTDGLDGYVSLEVSPKLAHDTENTVSEARRLFGVLGRPNVMIKVPATAEGLPAIEQLIGEGINVNVTLIFSLQQYDAVTAAYIAGLERLAAGGGDLRKVASVASFFVSRMDVKVDKLLEAAGNRDLQGRIAIANSKVVYARFKEIFGDDRWGRLEAQGARVQRPLWASTSTKNPAYPDTLYVDNLIGPHTVNTVPPATLTAILDHGRVELTLEQRLDEAQADLAALADLGIDLEKAAQELLDEGVEKFTVSFDDLLASIEEKRARLLGKALPA